MKPVWIVLIIVLIASLGAAGYYFYPDFFPIDENFVDPNTGQTTENTKDPIDELPSGTEQTGNQSGSTNDNADQTNVTTNTTANTTGNNSGGGGAGGAGGEGGEETVPPPTTPPPEDNETIPPPPGNYSLYASMDDVTGGEFVKSVFTGGSGAGDVYANYDAGQYDLQGAFTGLPDPSNEEFYEAWIARTLGGFNVVSLGQPSKSGSAYVITYSSSTDYRDHDLFVITVESNDGDPTPSDHVLSGSFQIIP